MSEDASRGSQPAGSDSGHEAIRLPKQVEADPRGAALLAELLEGGQAELVRIPNRTLRPNAHAPSHLGELNKTILEDVSNLRATVSATLPP